MVNSMAITTLSILATIGADFLTKEVVVDDRVVTMQVNSIKFFLEMKL